MVLVRASLIAVALLSLTCFANAQPAVTMSADVHRITMNAQNGSGESGWATLKPSGKNLIVTISLKNAPAAAQPAHIHKGTCANLDPTPAYPLSNVVNGKSVTTVSGISMATLMKGHFAVNVHKSVSQIKVYVSCGNI